VTLSTHALDIARGLPAAGIDVTLSRVENEVRTQIARAHTDAGGRVAAPFGGELAAGWYELTFACDAYFAQRSVAAFYGDITVRFRVEAAQEHYHVPLLLSPWGYSTYRGN
jgi:5-hydroxyisourate hydrolase